MKKNLIFTALLSVLFSFSSNAEQSKPNFIYDEIKDLSPNAKFITRAENRFLVGEGGVILENNDETKPFHWGSFALKQLSMSFDTIGVINIHYDDLFYTDNETPVFTIENVKCTIPKLGVKEIAFKQKANSKANSLNYQDYELFYCFQPLEYLTLNNQKIEFGDAYSEWTRTPQDYLDYFYRARGFEAKDYPITIGYGEINFVFDPIFKADKNHQIVEIETLLQTCDSEEPECNIENFAALPKIKVGNCEYNHFMLAKLTDFKENSAKWTFYPSRIEPELAPECVSQMLPYHLVSWQ